MNVRLLTWQGQRLQLSLRRKGHQSLNVAYDSLDVAVMFAHFLVVAAALGRRSALDVLTHKHINLLVLPLNLRSRKQCFVSQQKVHVTYVLL